MRVRAEATSTLERGNLMSIDDQTILLTGGTGSFGRKFTEIALTRYNPRRIIIFSRDELRHHDMQAQFFFIGDVRERDRG